MRGIDRSPGRTTSAMMGQHNTKIKERLRADRRQWDRRLSSSKNEANESVEDCRFDDADERVEQISHGDPTWDGRIAPNFTRSSPGPISSPVDCRFRHPGACSSLAWHR
jgi:hypothetical protein